MMTLCAASLRQLAPVRRKWGRTKMNVVSIADRFCAGWTSLDAEAFSTLFAPEGSYMDIAFGITRRGRDQVREHHRIWRTAVPEFAMLNERAYESGSAVIVKTICYGTFSGGDLGGGKLKATPALIDPASGSDKI